jgi:hypothetical protein
MPEAALASPPPHRSLEAVGATDWAVPAGQTEAAVQLRELVVVVK